jgi:hypothetical protein
MRRPANDADRMYRLARLATEGEVARLSASLQRRVRLRSRRFFHKPFEKANFLTSRFPHNR